MKNDHVHLLIGLLPGKFHFARLLLSLVFFFFVVFTLTASPGNRTRRNTNTTLLQDKKEITGNITDSETGEALPGVSILEKGTTNGTITNLDGNFTLSVAQNAIVEISFMGYVTQEISVVTTNNLIIKLVPDLISLDDVVVIGYGTVKKSDLTGSVASISVDEIKQSISSGVDQALQGKTAGVNVTTNTGAPGAAPTVRIRGIGTVTNPDPLYVVDGMPVSPSDVGSLNPGDIESMEILKDASASAIYGARAANGVVLITTKLGKKDKPRVSFDMFTGMQSLAKKYDILSAEEYITLRNEAGKPWEDSSAVASTDWQDEIFRPASISSYNLSFSGGSELTKYYLSGSYFDQNGILEGTDYERITARANITTQLKPWLTIGERFIYIKTKTHSVPEQNEYTSVIISALNMDPAQEVYDSLGEPAAAERNNIFNPVGILERNHNESVMEKLFGTGYIQIAPVDWLNFKSYYGFINSNTSQEIYFPEFYESVSNQRPVNGLFNGKYVNTNWVWENTLAFNKEFGKHGVQAIVGYTRQKRSYRQSLAFGDDVPENPNLWSISNATGETYYADVTNGTFQGIGVPTEPWDDAIVSYLGRAIYSYDDLFDVTGSVRRDGSSKFGEEMRWGVFKSFAAGLKLHQLPGIRDVSQISFLKLRVGWGEIGNQEIGDYGAYTTVTPDYNYNFGTYGNQTTLDGSVPISYPNKQLQWETTRMTNIGLDVHLLENSITLNADYFVRNTLDMLCEVPVPSVSGIQVPPDANKGTVSNKGIELNLTYKKRMGDFGYTVTGNFSYLTNEVTALGDEGEYISSAPFRSTSFVSRTEEGQPIASFYGYVTDGYWQNEDEITQANQLAQEAYPEEENVYYDRRFTSPGDIKFKDLNGDNRITSEDQQYIGSPHADYIYGINITLEYKQFDFSVRGQGVAGNDIFMATKYYLESPDLYWNGMTSMNDHWVSEGDITEVPRLDLRNQNNNLRFSDRYVVKGDYFRIKNIQLGYTLPESITEMLHIENLRVYVAGQNVFTFSDYKGFDPEIGVGRNQGNDISQRGTLDIGIDRGMYPVARTFIIGANLTF